jgi:hypothetical protein
LAFLPIWPENLDKIRMRPIFARYLRNIDQIFPLIQRQKFGSDRSGHRLAPSLSRMGFDRVYPVYYEISDLIINWIYPIKTHSREIWGKSSQAIKWKVPLV